MEESSGTAERILEYLSIQGVSAKSFAEDEKFGLAFDKGRIGKTATNRGTLGTDVVEKFLRMFPDVNPHWLLLGVGDMVVDKMDPGDHYGLLEHSYIKTLRDALKDLRENILDLRGSVKDKEKIINLLESRS